MWRDLFVSGTLRAGPFYSGRSVLQCVAVRCSVVPRVVVRCSVLQCVTVVGLASESRRGTWSNGEKERQKDNECEWERRRARKRKREKHTHTQREKLSDAFICVTWLINVRDMTHLHVWRACDMTLCWFAVASIRRLLKIIGLFCKRALYKRRYSAKETYHFKEPTNRSHPIVLSPEASWRRVFHPYTPLLFDLYHYLEQNGYFWLVQEHAPGPSSQFLLDCWVRHPCCPKKLFVQIYIEIL